MFFAAVATIKMANQITNGRGGGANAAHDAAAMGAAKLTAMLALGIVERSE